MTALRRLERQLREYSNEHGYWPRIWCVGPETYRATCHDLDRIAGRNFDSSTVLGARLFVKGTEIIRIGGKTR